MEKRESGVVTHSDVRRLALLARVGLASIISERSATLDAAGFVRWLDRSQWERLIHTHDDHLGLTVYHTPESPVAVPLTAQSNHPETTSFHARLTIANGTYEKHRDLVQAQLRPWFDVVVLPDSTDVPPGALPAYSSINPPD